MTMEFVRVETLQGTEIFINLSDVSFCQKGKLGWTIVFSSNSAIIISDKYFEKLKSRMNIGA